VTYVLEDLLRVREFKERSAAAELSARRAAYAEAVRLEEQRESELAAYRIQRLEEEAALFGNVRNQQIKVRDLDDLKIEIQLLREKEQNLQQQLEAARAARQEAGKDLEQARESYFGALREKQKIEAHKETWVEETGKEAARLEDKESEEFKLARFDFAEEVHDDEGI